MALKYVIDKTKSKVEKAGLVVEMKNERISKYIIIYQLLGLR